MAALSKLFEEHFSWRRCNELLHPHTCKRAAGDNFRRFCWSNSKYYIPVAVLYLIKQSLRNNENFWNILKDAIWYHQQLTFGALTNGWVIATTMCALRNLLGKFQLYSLVFLPSIIGGVFTTCLPDRVKHVQHTGIFQSLIESLLIQSKIPMTEFLTSSLTLQTLVFMCCSTVIIEGKQKGWHKGFWFLSPEIFPSDNIDNASCVHQEPDCSLYIVKGMRNYFLIGLALDLFKALISCIKSGQWNMGHFSLESVCWLVSYVGIYRATQCYLTRNQNLRGKFKYNLPSFLAGLSYLWYPKRTILSFGLLGAIRSIWSRYKGTLKYPFGCSDVIFPIALAYLIHNYVFDPRSVSGLAAVIINSTTANYALDINKRLLQLQ